MSNHDVLLFQSMLRVVWKRGQAARVLAKQLRFNHKVFFQGHERSAVIMMAIVIGLFLLCYAFYLRCSFVILFSTDQSVMIRNTKYLFWK